MKPRIINYPTFEDAFKAAWEFMAKGIRCKGISLTALEVYDVSE